jgi:hypothetical protein
VGLSKLNETGTESLGHFRHHNGIGRIAHPRLSFGPQVCLLKTSSIGGILAISNPKAPGIIKFSQADEVLRRDTGYHTCPLGADVAAAARIPFLAHRHSVVAAHWPVAAERDNKKDFGP